MYSFQKNYNIPKLPNQSDLHRILSFMLDKLKEKKSSILVLKKGQGFTSAVAIVIGKFEVGMFLIYREQPTQYLTLVRERD